MQAVKCTAKSGVYGQEQRSNLLIPNLVSVLVSRELGIVRRYTEQADFFLVVE